MKKTITIILVVLLCLSTLAGCSPKQEATAAAPAPQAAEAEAPQAADAPAAPAEAASEAVADWPKSGETLTIIVPYKAGGGVDVAARLLVPYLEKELGITVVVENQPGGNCIPATMSVINAKEDGYTIGIFASGALIGSPQLYENPFDPRKDIIPIVSNGSVPMVIAAGPDTPYKTVDEMVAYLKDNPGGLTYGVAGLRDVAGIEVYRTLQGLGVVGELVPYDGAAGAVTAVAGGHVDYCIAPVSTLTPYVEEGTLVPIIECGGLESNAFGVPSISSLGHPEYAILYYRVVGVKAGTPDNIVQKLREAFTNVLTSEEVQKAFEDANDPLINVITDGDKLASMIASEYDAYGLVFEEMGDEQ